MNSSFKLKYKLNFAKSASANAETPTPTRSHDVLSRVSLEQSTWPRRMMVDAASGSELTIMGTMIQQMITMVNNYARTFEQLKPERRVRAG